MYKKTIALLTALFVAAGVCLPVYAEDTDIPADVSAAVYEQDAVTDAQAEPGWVEETPYENDDTAVGAYQEQTDADEPADTAADEMQDDASVSGDAGEDITSEQEDDVAEEADDISSDEQAEDTADDVLTDAENEADTDDDGLTEDEDEYYAIQPVKVTASTFPDPNFREYVLDTFDTDNNYTLDANEILYARNIKANGMNIKSLKGIEYLVELRGLYCTDNQISTMDLSKNKLITGIWCSGNLYSSLDFSANPDLEWVYCFDCPNLRSLNVRNNPKMSYIECSDSPIGTLDVSKNPLLEHLICANCALSTLDLSKNPNLQHLDAFNNANDGPNYPMRNRLTKLDLSNNKKMRRLDIWANYDLKFVDVSMCPDLTYYNCAKIGATRVDVSKNPNLDKLICSYNNIKTLDLSHNPKLTKLYCECNGLTKLDLSKNPKMHYLQAFTNSFTTLDLGYTPFLVKTYKEGTKRAEAVCKGHSWTIDYGGDSSTGKDDIYFLCIDDVVKVKTDLHITTTVDDDDSDLTDTEGLITRETVINTLYNMAGKPSVSGLTTRFKDVKSGTWYYNSLLWAQKNSIAVGYPDVSSDNFGVGKYIRRQDLVYMLMRYAEYMGYKREIDFGRSDDFIDANEVDSYAWEAMCWACTWNIVIGKGAPGAPKSERYLDPHGRATVDEFNEMIDRLHETNHVSGSSSSSAAPAKPTVTIKAVFGGRVVQFNCADTNVDIYYCFGTSHITRDNKHVKAGGTVFLNMPLSGSSAAMYFKAYRNGQWSPLGKWGVLNVKLDKPQIIQSGAKSANQFKVYTQAKNSYIIYTLDGSTPAINAGSQKLTVKNGTIIWGTSGVITVPKGRTVKAIAIRSGLVTSDVMTYTNK